MHTDTRLQMIHDWLIEVVGLPTFTIVPASADASFRRYFRVTTPRRTLIVMDAPPGKEDVTPFLRVRLMMAECQVHVPQVYANDVARGLVLMEDMGDTSMLAALQAGAAPKGLYTDALKALVALQVRGRKAMHDLPEYDATVLQREMDLMPQWFCEKHLQLVLSEAQREVIAAAQAYLTEQILQIPQVFVHRDYHSRNLMIPPLRPPGVIDFQDALRGPAPYDVVSLLKDCYVQWSRRQIEDWVAEFRKLMAKKVGPNSELLAANQEQYMQWLDLVGLQRHLKVLGIFARLFWRDGKSGYLDDLPLTLDYAVDAAYRFTALRPLAQLLDKEFQPRLGAANAFAFAARLE